MSTSVEGRGARTIVIDPVTRIEGHGKVTICLNEDGTIARTRFHIVEFRGFERFILGKPYRQVPLIVERLCGICPVSHHLCAAKALDVTVGADRLTATAEKVRRLMHYGQIVQSHALHYFYLASPDLLFGFDAPVAKRSIVGIIAEYPEIAKWAIQIRKYGQEVIKATGGKKVHPTSAVPGGVTQNLSVERRDALRKDIDQIIAWSAEALALYTRFFRADAQRHAEFGTVASNYVSLVRSDGAMDLYDGGLRAIDADGRKIFDGLTPIEYTAHVAEEVRPWTYLKFPYLRAVGRERGWYRVGPLAQINCCDFIDTPIAERARQEFVGQGHGRPVHLTLAYHWARLINMIHAAEKIKDLLYDDALQGTDLVTSGTRRAEGAAWVEAPRGTLYHHYRVDDRGQVASANLIVATTNNNEAMNRSVARVAQDYLSGREITDALLNHIEVAIRAYDPCLSCATHALGQMPLIVTLQAPDGAELARRTRA